MFCAESEKLLRHDLYKLTVDFSLQDYEIKAEDDKAIRAEIV